MTLPTHARRQAVANPFATTTLPDVDLEPTPLWWRKARKAELRWHNSKDKPEACRADLAWDIFLDPPHHPKSHETLDRPELERRWLKNSFIPLATTAPTPLVMTRTHRRNYYEKLMTGILRAEYLEEVPAQATLEELGRWHNAQIQLIWMESLLHEVILVPTSAGLHGDLGMVKLYVQNYVGMSRWDCQAGSMQQRPRNFRCTP